MRKPLPLLILSILLLSATISRSQDFEFGKFTFKELEMKNYDKDTSAHAVVLNEHGYATITSTNNDELRLVYKYHVKIKIFDKAGYDNAKIELPFYSQDGQTYEEIQSIQAVTAYKDETGNIATVDLDPHKIYTAKDSKHWSSMKFAMPGIRDGCIIEYEYTLVSPYWQNFHTWWFQSSIPKMYSEYDVHIPGFWTFNASIVGSFKLTKNIAEVERECFTYYGAKADCSHFVYGMSDIPALVPEDHMTSARNFLSAITFELAEETNMQGGGKRKIANDWSDIDYELKHAEYFGNQLKKESLFRDKIAPVIAGKTDSLDKAKAIYAYIKKTIKWNEDNDYGSADGIRQALANRTGNSAEVNFCLFAALKAAGFNPAAVMLSTRDHGYVNKLYPVMTEFDYVVVKLDLNNKTYLLDATEPLLSFGMLPMRCLNDKGRVMSLDKPSYWIDMNTPQKENDIYNLDLTLQADGKIKGTVTHYCVGYAAYSKRQEISKFNSTDEYIESLNEKSHRYKIVKADIQNLDSLDKTLSEVFEVEIKEYDNTNFSRLTFNPVLQDRITENPFKLAERSYPVDWGMPSATRYAMTIHLPDGYTVESNPQKVNYSLPDGGGNFVTNYNIPDDHTMEFSYAMQLNRSIYIAEEYPYLKEFYNKIILTEKGETILNKKP